MLAVNQPTLEEMRANLRAMKMNHGRKNIEKNVALAVARREHKQAIKDGVTRFLQNLSWGLAQVVQARADAEKSRAHREAARLVEIKEGVSTFLISLSLMEPRLNDVRCTEFSELEMDRAQKKFFYYIERQHPRLFSNINNGGQSSRKEKEMIAACVRYARFVAGEIIKKNDVNEGERLTGEISLETLESQVRRKHRFSPKEFRAKRRFRDLTTARQEFMWLASKHTTHSLPEIARYLGGLDHTTILHGIRKHEKRMQEAV